MLSESDLSLARGQRSRSIPTLFLHFPEQGFLASLGMTVMTEMLQSNADPMSAGSVLIPFSGVIPKPGVVQPGEGSSVEASPNKHCLSPRQIPRQARDDAE